MADGLRAMALELDDSRRGALLRYLALLARWNRAFNLTAVRDPAGMVSRQLLDSLSVLPWIEGPRVLDVGSGAGLPGIPLAVARPDIAFTLLDSNGKKTRFLRQVVGELQLANVVVEQCRVERLQVAAGFDQIVSRAFASTADLLRLTGHLLRPGGQWLALKGRYENASAQLPEQVSGVHHPLVVPGCDGARHLLLLRKTGDG